MYFLLRESPLDPDVSKPATYLVENLKMVWDVPDGTVVRKLARRLLDTLLCSGRAVRDSTVGNALPVMGGDRLAWTDPADM